MKASVVRDTDIMNPLCDIAYIKIEGRDEKWHFDVAEVEHIAEQLNILFEKLEETG